VARRPRKDLTTPQQLTGGVIDLAERLRDDLPVVRNFLNNLELYLHGMDEAPPPAPLMRRQDAGRGEEDVGLRGGSVEKLEQALNGLLSRIK